MIAMLALATANVGKVNGAAADTASACPAEPVGEAEKPTADKKVDTVQDRLQDEMLERIRGNRDRALYLRAKRARVQGLEPDVTARATEMEGRIP
jgi:hypothetical protein